MATLQAVTACAVFVLLSAITATRVPVWTSERALWTDAVQGAPLKPRPWVNLGREYALAGDDALAAWAYSQAITVAQDRPADERRLGTALAQANLALLARERGDDVAAAGWIAAARAARITEVEGLEWDRASF